MFVFLKVLHLLAVAFGSVASLGNVFLMLSSGPHDLAAPGYTNTLRKLFRTTALAAIILFWVSGVLMMFSKYGLWLNDGLFNIKIVLVSLLSLSVVFLNFMASVWAHGSGPPAYVKTIHWLNAASFLIVVVIAGWLFG